MVLILDKETKKSNDAFRNSEWGPEAAEQMCNEVKDFPILNGDGTKTLNDLIEMSPKRLISKVMLEEKVFKTWYSGRTVMLGDGKNRKKATFEKIIIENKKHPTERSKTN